MGPEKRHEGLTFLRKEMLKHGAHHDSVKLPHARRQSVTRRRFQELDVWIAVKLLTRRQEVVRELDTDNRRFEQ